MKTYLGQNRRDQSLKKTKVIAASAVFLACRQCKVSRSLAEICRGKFLKRKELGKGYKAMRKILSIRGSSEVRTDVTQLIRRYVHKLCLGPPMCANVIRCAIRIANALKTNFRFQSRNPLSVLSAIIYISLRCYGIKTWSPRRVATIVKVAENTATNCARNFSSTSCNDCLLYTSPSPRDRG